MIGAIRDAGLSFSQTVEARGAKRDAQGVTRCLGSA
jgi:hypothetical protein